MSCLSRCLHQTEGGREMAGAEVGEEEGAESYSSSKGMARWAYV